MLFIVQLKFMTEVFAKQCSPTGKQDLFNKNCNEARDDSSAERLNIRPLKAWRVSEFCCSRNQLDRRTCSILSMRQQKVPRVLLSTSIIVSRVISIETAWYPGAQNLQLSNRFKTNLVLTTELIMQFGHCKEFLRLAFKLGISPSSNDKTTLN